MEARVSYLRAVLLRLPRNLFQTRRVGLTFRHLHSLGGDADLQSRNQKPRPYTLNYNPRVPPKPVPLKGIVAEVWRGDACARLVRIESPRMILQLRTPLSPRRAARRVGRGYVYARGCHCSSPDMRRTASGNNFSSRVVLD